MGLDQSINLVFEAASVLAGYRGKDSSRGLFGIVFDPTPGDT